MRQEAEHRKGLRPLIIFSLFYINLAYAEPQLHKNAVSTAQFFGASSAEIPLSVDFISNNSYIVNMITIL